MQVDRRRSAAKSELVRDTDMREAGRQQRRDAGSDRRKDRLARSWREQGPRPGQATATEAGESGRGGQASGGGEDEACLADERDNGAGNGIRLEVIHAASSKFAWRQSLVDAL